MRDRERVTLLDLTFASEWPLAVSSPFVGNLIKEVVNLQIDKAALCVDGAHVACTNARQCTMIKARHTGQSQWSIDEEEFAAFVAASAEESAGLPGAPDEKSEPASKAFETIAKSDMKITKAELVDARSKSFDKADADGDKALDALEQQRFAALIAAKPDKADKTQ